MELHSVKLVGCFLVALVCLVAFIYLRLLDRGHTFTEAALFMFSLFAFLAAMAL